jgi:DNA-binding GntR family transcriptional regulator
MREIIGQLASQGYLTVKPNRGAIVTKLSLEDMRVIYNILTRLESYGAALFARQGDRAVMKKLDLLCGKMEAKDLKSKYRTWLQMNERFHELIYMHCGNGILADIIYHTRLRIYRFRTFKTESEIINSYNDQHREIMTAIREGNEILADRLMGSHLETAGRHRFEICKGFAELL